MQKNVILENIARELDIPPSKYEQAIQRKEGIEGHLTSDPALSSPEVHLQGSFRLGTVIRPLKEDRQGDYDVDIVCKLNRNEQTSTPEEIKRLVGTSLRENGTYEKILDEEGKRCWTLKYAENDGVGFHIDILPSIPARIERQMQLTLEGVSKSFADKAITITDKNEATGQYEWNPSNPEGYALWFDQRNTPLINENREYETRVLMERHQDFFAERGGIDDRYIRTPLQRTIQILKRHRDQYFLGNELAEYKPISVIITTLVTHLAQPGDTVETLLERFVDRVEHIEHKPIQNVFYKNSSGEWEIPNPVDPNNENFADRWANPKDGHMREQAFFEWANALPAHFTKLFKQRPNDAPALLTEALVKDRSGEKLAAITAMTATAAAASIAITAEAKPWKDNG